MASNQVATDFEKIINAGRDRKKNEALAAKIFNKDRRASAPLKPALGGSLASRVGVKKRIVSTGPRGPPKTASPRNIGDESRYDLHDRSSGPGKVAGYPLAAAQPTNNSLAARITNPNAPGLRRQQQRRAVQIEQALLKTDPAAVSAKPSSPASGFNRGMTIRGLAGPFVVMAQNFAPGTTAADIESAMTPVGGLISSCRLLKTSPIVVAEIVFESKEGAENVIATFNNQTADGRILHVYHKVGGGSNSRGTTPASAPAAAHQSSWPPANAPSGPRAHRGRGADVVVVDGTMGFGDPNDPMDSDDGTSSRKQNGAGSNGVSRDGASRNGAGAYSDSPVRTNHRGRGYGRGGRSGSRR